MLTLALALGCNSDDGTLDCVDGDCDPDTDDSTDSVVPPGDDDDDDDTVPTEPSCETVATATERAGVQPMERWLDVELSAADTVWAVCTSAAAPGEQHLVEATTAGTTHALAVRGLLANTAYECEVHAGCGGTPGSASFTTGVPTMLPQLTAATSPGASLDGAYTLFNTQDGCQGAPNHVVFVDPDGKARWMYTTEPDLLADIDASLVDSEHVHVGGGWGLFDEGQPNRGIFRTIDLSGNPVIERTVPDYGNGFNHHSQPLGDGRYLNLTGWDDTDGVDTWVGVGVEVWDPTNGVTWTWNSQGLVDLGLLQKPGPFDSFGLAYHANAAAWRTDASGDALWISSYGDEALWRIDRATGQRTHVFGDGGDFTLVDANGTGLPRSEWPFVQHGPDWTDDDHVLVYDNGVDRPGGEYSRVAEYAVDLAAERVTRLWSWTEPGWFDVIIGDADFTPNGHVLVVQGFSQCLAPFRRDTSEILELLPPGPGQTEATVLWRLTWPGPAHQVYRGERYGGCDVFANARYCPAVADRIAELRGD